MAIDTKYSLRKESIYQIYTRAYSKEGTLKKIEENLSHIKDLGFTIVYLLPVHENGILNKKGSLGCPYSIRDYYDIGKEYGSLDDFKSLVEKAHKLDMKIMTDIVINHTACDAIWTKTHPEYYYLENGLPSQKIKDWSDIYDLDYTKKDLQDELVNMMCYWAKIGVDGFRCDVAPLVPLDFWVRARKNLKEINPNFFMLAESGEQYFIEKLREENIPVSTDAELYEAFDICYCYDIQEFYKNAIKKEYGLKEFGHALNYQQAMLPKTAVKCWYLENHDQERIMSKLNDKERVKNWTAFMLLMKGIGFVYAGQEVFATHRPSLFDKDVVDFSKEDIDFSTLIKNCNMIKKKMFLDDEYVNLRMLEYDDILAFRQYDSKSEYQGYFDVNNKKEEVKVNLEDGEYLNLLDDTKFMVKDFKLLVDRPIMVKVK